MVLQSHGPDLVDLLQVLMGPHVRSQRGREASTTVHSSAPKSESQVAASGEEKKCHHKHYQILHYCTVLCMVRCGHITGLTSGWVGAGQVFVTAVDAIGLTMVLVQHLHGCVRFLHTVLLWLQVSRPKQPEAEAASIRSTCSPIHTYN